MVILQKKKKKYGLEEVAQGLRAHTAVPRGPECSRRESGPAFLPSRLAPGHRTSFTPETTTQKLY